MKAGELLGLVVGRAARGGDFHAARWNREGFAATARNPSGLSYDITGSMRHERFGGAVLPERLLEAAIVERAKRRAGIA